MGMPTEVKPVWQSVDDLPVTRKQMKVLYKRLNDRIDECFDEMHKGDDEQAAFWDEHENKIERLTRALRRLQKEVKELEEE